MVRKWVLQGATIVSALCVLPSIVLWKLSYEFQPNYLCAFVGVLGYRLDLSLNRGVILFDCLSDYEYSTPFLVGLNESESEQDLEYFKALSWWHGDNSWWERVGFTVKQRIRFGDFEYATGVYWPPFCWQHAKMPFTVVQLPLWACVLASSFLPAIWMVNRWLRAIHRKRMATHIAKFGESEVTRMSD